MWNITSAKDIFAGIDPTRGDAILIKETRHVVSDSFEVVVQIIAVDCK
jgi:hypothetical protein